MYLNDEDIRYLGREATPIGAADTVSIVPSVAGGVGVAEPPELTRDEVQRYSRHLILPEVGVDGQRKLKAATGVMRGRRRPRLAGRRST